MIGKPEGDPAGRVRVGEGRESQAAFESDRRLRIARRDKREPVCLGLVAARDGVRERQRPHLERKRDEEPERDERRVAQAASRLRGARDEVDPRDREEREPGRPLPDVATGDVRELVRRDGEDLGARETAGQERVVEDDAPRRADPGHVGVRGRRPPARVSDLHPLDADAELPTEPLDPGRQPLVRQRLEAVEERLDRERLGEHEEDAERGERRTAGEPPVPAEPAG